MNATLMDRDGVRHFALIPNDEDAWWTPVACGDGVCLPGRQTDEPVDCPDCLLHPAATIPPQPVETGRCPDCGEPCSCRDQAYCQAAALGRNERSDV